MTQLQDRYKEAVLVITREQEKIVGKEIALQMGRRVDNLKIHGNSVEILGDPKVVLFDLVNQYANLFGKASIEVSKEALRKIGPLKNGEIPDNLK